MAAVGGEEVEYESDPEDAKRLLAMRRREASDDEEGDGEGREDSRMDRRGVVLSDESDSQGGAADYYDDEELEGEDEVYEYGEYEDGIDEEVDEVKVEEGGNEERNGGVEALVVRVKEADGDGSTVPEELAENQVEEGKKENEPFAVPTAGAFYMHDDRFRDNARGRHRRTLGGRKLWESRDDRKWGHDKFEELTFQERHYEEGRRSSRGNYRTRGKNQVADRGYVKRNKSKVFNENNNNGNNLPPKGVRGRGSRRYEPSNKNNSQAPTTQNKQSGKSFESTSHANTVRGFMPMSNAESSPGLATKHMFASSLSSASPPFYPSASSSKDSSLTQKRNAQAGSTNRNLRQSVMEENVSLPQSNPLLRGKNIVDSVGMDKLYIDNSVTPVTGEPLVNYQMSSGSSPINSDQSTQSRAQGRGLVPSGELAYQFSSSRGQVNVAPPSQQFHAVQRGPVQSRNEPFVQATTQQLGHRPGSGSQASSPPSTALAMNSFEPGKVKPSLESTQPKSTLVGNGKGIVQGSGRGSFLYRGAQVMGATGNMGGGHGDQNFPGTATFLPVMQFGGQHPGGMGVPAVGMAFPGYVAQPQLGLGNSEMTWLPVLAGGPGALGAAGALGATYCSPYITVDGAYHPRPSGQTASISLSSKDNGTNKTNNELKSSQRSELVSNENGQRQNKPRRYSEMNFGQ